MFQRPALAVAFTVTDADFVGGIYDFHFYNYTSSKTVVNGTNLGISNPTLTNNGWVCCSSDGANRYWHAAGAFSATQTSGELTMGWDFSGVTGQIASVELKPGNYLHQFGTWVTHAVGDQISGSVRTPTSFGSGTLTELYRYTGQTGGTTQANNTLSNITSNLAGTWLADPALLELAFAYSQTPSPTIPGRHIQIFTDNTAPAGTGNSGFVLRVTLSETVSPIPIPASLPLFMAGLVGLGATAGWRRVHRGGSGTDKLN